MWQKNSRWYSTTDTYTGRSWLCTEQAGFHKNRSCEGQILSLATRPKMTVLPLLDNFKAFDHVYRGNLIFSAITRGLMIIYAHCLRDSGSSTEKQKSGTEADTFHYTGDFHKRSHCTSSTFGEEHLKTRRCSYCRQCFILLQPTQQRSHCSSHTGSYNEGGGVRLPSSINTRKRFVCCSFILRFLKWRERIDALHVVKWIAESPKMVHLSPSFMKTIIRPLKYFQKIN